jgi:hypothetical protein
VAAQIAIYFDSPASGGSSYGAMCERLEAASYTSVTCVKCGGSGVREMSRDELTRRYAAIVGAKPFDRHLHGEALSRDSTCQRCNGSGVVAGKRFRYTSDIHFHTTRRCARCKGTMEVLTKTSHEVQDVCQRCMGAGCMVPVTAKSTGNSKKGKPPKRTPMSAADAAMVAADAPVGASIDEDALLERAKVGRIADALRAKSAVAAQVLRAYYGPEGDRWGAHRWGRIFVVWPLTKPGQKLAEICGGALSLGALASVRENEERALVPRSHIRRLMHDAAEAARHLVEHAEAALAEVSQ